jgi:arabinofuranan 3-O-arabinosyltransferase
LVFTNINGCILLCEVLFLCWLLDGRQSREWLSGFAIGLSLTVKPVLAPLLLIPLLNRQWRVLAMAMAVPLALNIVAWRMVIDRRAFLEGTIPYILSTRDYFNSSVLGNGIYYGLPMWLITALRVLFVILAAGSLWLLYRYYRQRDTFFWVLTSSGVLLTASWLVLSLAQGYYSMMLFPFLMTVVLPNSVLRNWPAWLATYGFLTLDRWLMWRWPTTGRFLEYMKITYGWSLMLIVVFCVLLFRYLDAREDGRLADGIDPPWMEQAARERRLAPT